MTGRWISQSSAQRNLGLFIRAEITNLRRFADVRYASAGTVVAAAGTHVTAVQIVVDGELEPMAAPSQAARRWRSSAPAR